MICGLPRLSADEYLGALPALKAPAPAIWPKERGVVLSW
jgi:hypothetical protein